MATTAVRTYGEVHVLIIDWKEDSEHSRLYYEETQRLAQIFLQHFNFSVSCRYLNPKNAQYTLRRAITEHIHNYDAPANLLVFFCSSPSATRGLGIPTSLDTETHVRPSSRYMEAALWGSVHTTIRDAMMSDAMEGDALLILDDVSLEYALAAGKAGGHMFNPGQIYQTMVSVWSEPSVYSSGQPSFIRSFCSSLKEIPKQRGVLPSLMLCRKINEKLKSHQRCLLWEHWIELEPLSNQYRMYSHGQAVEMPYLQDRVSDQDGIEGVNRSLEFSYKLQFTRPLVHTVQDACKTATERLVGIELSWWPLSEPERELEASCTRVYSQALIHSSTRSPSFYDDIPNSLAEKLFGELAAARRTAPKSRWATRNRDSVILSGTTLIRLLSSYNDRPNQSTGKEDQLSLPYASKGSQNITSTVSKGKGRQKNRERDDKSSIEMTDYNEGSTKDAGGSQPAEARRAPPAEAGQAPPAEAGRSPPAKDSANDNEEDPGKGSPKGVPAKVDTKQCIPDGTGPVVFVCAEQFTNVSRARSAFIGANDTDRTTMENLRKAYNALGSRYFWKRRTGVKFYRFRTFKQTLQEVHHVQVFKGEEVLPLNHPEYNCEIYADWEEKDPLPSGELWHYFNDPKQCGTDSTLQKMLPKKINNDVLAKKKVYGMFVEQRHSVWQIVILNLLVLALTLGGTIWFIPRWLKEHPGDLQNAIVPSTLALMILQFVSQLCVSVVVFRWSI
ncbi:hypothetical protein HBI56_165430 [Parastagonospora nodorum]|nr:hypothetical protein HBH51_040180 [Parastagonospora nodorum]KAH3994957.1 hypothetical protein HBI10_180090 [Parastagonospora nodorum]KAH4014982.1 hypothetical protein HBI13_165220 [Parastagonospora nodorum]KAH4125296.1 hypothetical protein HBH47_065080 [Parastagonospora nodorum]KAH4173951.1 hypothetical protein HBH43_085190 [Parastagonospora nodorum]